MNLLIWSGARLLIFFICLINNKAKRKPRFRSIWLSFSTPISQCEKRRKIQLNVCVFYGMSLLPISSSWIDFSSITIKKYSFFVSSSLKLQVYMFLLSHLMKRNKVLTLITSMQLIILFFTVNHTFVLKMKKKRKRRKEKKKLFVIFLLDERLNLSENYKRKKFSIKNGRKSWNICPLNRWI